MLTTLNQLKGVVKVGDKVKGGENHQCIELDGERVGTITQVDDDCVWINNCWHNFNQTWDIELLPRSKEITRGNLFEGDVVVDKKDTSKKYKVLGICGDAVFLSGSKDHDAALSFYTHTQITKDCFLDLPDTDQPKPREVTMKEVCEKFGEEVTVKKE